MKNELNLAEIKNIYCIGIKGSGVVAVAQILKARGINISGSDSSEKFFTDEILKRENIKYFETFLAEHINKNIDLVVYSTAYSEENNVEMKQAKALGLRMFSYPQMLGFLFRERLGIAVTGSHGKTTTSAILATVLEKAQLSPSAVIGSEVIGWKASILAGSGDYFVAEADEYQNKLAFYDPWAVILTSVDWDHPDFFPDIFSYKKVFKDFVAKIPQTGNLVIWGDSVDTLDVSRSAHCRVIKYGFGEDNDYRIINFELKEENNIQKQIFEIVCLEKNIGKFETTLSGKHNILNCAAVIALASRMNIATNAIREGIATFQGTKRRFEQIGFYNGALLIDDYAHHPDEIKATIKGARERFKNKQIYVVFHPHTFTRTKALLAEFSQSFDDADKVVVIDIYGSAREKQGGVSSLDLVKLINKYTFEKAQHIPTINEAIEYYAKILKKDDVLITMGAGDVWKIVDKLKEI
jgi:UDP-N-acetylmuramate--alanine ligase